ncbi:MAG: double zinc ribbon domain-containing protein [Candidatus Eisenbacteria bacterium]
MMIRWEPLARQSVQDVTTFLWPQRCPGCGVPPARGALLCAACLERIPRFSLPLCARCLAHEAADPVCAKHPGFRVWPAWLYDERAALAIEAFKYGQRTDLAAGFASELVRVVPPGFPADVVTEVPLHPARERERGYNQSALLAARLASAAGLPYVPRVLERVRATRAQARLGPTDRRRNLLDAFRVRHPEQWAGRRTLVVDDVITTGATLEAALAVLGAAGVRAEALALAWAQ